MDLPTYTNIWRIKKRLYKLYDFRLPAPLPITWIGVFVGITVPYVLFLIAVGLPFNHNLVWLYILPPGVFTWLTTRPVIEGKRLPELVSSKLRYVAEPRTWCRMAPLAEKDEILVTARVWHHHPPKTRLRKARKTPAGAGRNETVLQAIVAKALVAHVAARWVVPRQVTGRPTPQCLFSPATGMPSWLKSATAVSTATNLSENEDMGSMRRDMTQQVLQIVFDRFYGDGGTWPALGYVQRTLNRQSGSRVDAVRIVQRIPGTLLKPLPITAGYPRPTEKLILTAEGIECCTGSSEDIENFLTAVKWLAKRADRSDLSGNQGERGVRFTPSQLAEAVSLSLDTDQKAVSRLLAILEAEGWLIEYGGTRIKP